jgi:hypothetical protein
MDQKPEQTGSPSTGKRSRKGDGSRRRRRKNQKAAKTEQKKQKPERQSAPIVVPRVQEPVPVCTICNKPIEAIAQAICGPEPHSFSHFDCVLRKIADEEHLQPHQKVSYIGRGTFAVIETDSEGKFVIIKRIPYETPETFANMKRYVEEQKR